MKNSRRKFGFLCLNLKNAKAWGILFYGNVNKMSYTPMKIREMVRHGFKSKIYPSGVKQVRNLCHVQ